MYCDSVLMSEIISHLLNSLPINRGLRWRQNETDAVNWSSPKNRSRRPNWGVEVQFCSFSHPGVRRGWAVNSKTRPPYTLKRDAVPIAQEAGWAPGQFWTGAENIAPTGIRSPDRPARSESLHRLSRPSEGSNEKRKWLWKIAIQRSKIVRCVEIVYRKCIQYCPRTNGVQEPEC
jgi:hypothetical protein